jgi:hypothetical protein
MLQAHFEKTSPAIETYLAIESKTNGRDKSLKSFTTTVENYNKVFTGK